MKYQNTGISVLVSLPKMMLVNLMSTVKPDPWL